MQNCKTLIHQTFELSLHLNISETSGPQTSVIGPACTCTQHVENVQYVLGLEWVWASRLLYNLILFSSPDYTLKALIIAKPFISTGLNLKAFYLDKPTLWSLLLTFVFPSLHSSEPEKTH